jgi:hypothetical protein
MTLGRVETDATRRTPVVVVDKVNIYMYIYVMAANRKLYTFWIDGDLADGLKAVKERDGISESEQIRRAVRAWLERKDVLKKTARRRAATRRTA